MSARSSVVSVQSRTISSSSVGGSSNRAHASSPSSRRRATSRLSPTPGGRARTPNLTRDADEAPPEGEEVAVKRPSGGPPRRCPPAPLDDGFADALIAGRQSGQGGGSGGAGRVREGEHGRAEPRLAEERARRGRLRGGPRGSRVGRQGRAARPGRGARTRPPRRDAGGLETGSAPPPPGAPRRHPTRAGGRGR